MLEELVHLFTCIWFVECSTTESDDIEKQEFEEVSDEDEVFFYDTKDSFSENSFNDEVDSNAETMPAKMRLQNKYSHIQRRKQLPDPVEKEKRVSLWSMIKDNVGKDLTRVCLPVYFNEPISSLQKCFEDMEYSYLLDQAYEQGKQVSFYKKIQASYIPCYAWK